MTSIPPTPNNPTPNHQTSGSSIQKASSDKELDHAARDVFMKAVFVVIFYITLGTLTYSIFEGFTIIDAIYFSTVTLTTVGYGDQDDWSGDGIKLFTSFYVLVGIMLIGAALGIIGAQLVEEQEKKNESSKTKALEQGHNLAIVKGAQTFSSKYPTVSKLLPKFATLLATIVVGSVFAALDGVGAENDKPSVVDCIYFAVITMTTVGYGDLSPSTNVGKLIGSLYLLFGCAAVAQVLGGIAGVYIEAKAEAARLAILKKKITLEDFKAFDVDGDGTIERSEFIIRKLMLMGLVNQGDISLCENEFMSMDTDGSGEITLEDLAHHLEDMAKKAAQIK